MKKYPLIDTIGLQFHVFDNTGTYYIKADDLENSLQNASVVYSEKVDGFSWRSEGYVQHEFKARLLCVEPIKKKTKAEAALEVVNELSKAENFGQVHDLINKSKQILEMPE